MASSCKILMVCFSLLLASFAGLVDAGHGMMGGLFGGGHHHGDDGVAALLAAGLLAHFLSNQGHHQQYGYHGRASYVPHPEVYAHASYAPLNNGLYSGNVYSLNQYIDY